MPNVKPSDIEKVLFACIDIDKQESNARHQDFHHRQDAFQRVVDAYEAALATANARVAELDAWSQKRLIVCGPIRYDVLGAENVKNHETVHDFIEVLSPPSTEATLAISAHIDLMQQLSNALELATAANARADEAEAMCGRLAHSACSCLGAPECDTFFENDSPEKATKCADCQECELTRARAAVTP